MTRAFDKWGELSRTEREGWTELAGITVRDTSVALSFTTQRADAAAAAERRGLDLWAENTSAAKSNIR